MRLIDVHGIPTTGSNLARLRVQNHSLELITVVLVDGLQDMMRSGEDDDGIAGYVNLWRLRVS